MAETDAAYICRTLHKPQPTRLHAAGLRCPLTLFAQKTLDVRREVFDQRGVSIEDSFAAGLGKLQFRAEKAGAVLRGGVDER